MLAIVGIGRIAGIIISQNVDFVMPVVMCGPIVDWRSQR